MILISLTANIPKTLLVHFNFYLMGMHVCEIGIVTYYFQEILKFEFGQCQNNQSSQHFQAHFVAQEKIH